MKLTKIKRTSRRKEILLSLSRSKSILSEQVRSIRTSITFSSTERLKTLLVTSAEAGAGKSFLSTNLAISFADQDLRVLLVDSDLRRPTTHEYLRLLNTVGLSNYLTGQEELGNCIQHTIFENLYVITSGIIPPNPAELLSSEKMKNFVNTVSDMFDIVIFDAPPVLPVVDPLIIASLVDGVVFNIHSGRTDQQSAMKAVEKLKSVDSRIIGVVLNNKKRKDSAPYERYYEYSYKK
ncbi:CpsD/CapB family tyrosine-protein kinase [Listeria booriae]|uniref:non-specific protein-tyrosine kinase n=1 Tax=Listeria booriae TaxID=1552123 RepID=A0A841ZUG5_9LIST|nr:CpsD/CapB family tyrosine-protein kinase [Listeria booriae]MBC1565085.1 CpsD/CapB family tyrosine-protein kinase [Listeria booriae]